MFGVKYKCDSGSRSSRCCVMACYVVVLVYCMCGVVTSMRVKHFFVPEKANLKSTESIHMECDLEVNETERRQVVIQWFLNATTLLYQWSENRTSRVPYINYNFLDSDTRHKTLVRNGIGNVVIHAPIVITNKTINHAGMYRCQATGIADDDAEDSDEMLIYVPVDNITLEQVYDNNTNALNVTCGTEDVYPKPEIKLLVNGKEYSEEISQPVLDVRIKENQLFDITSSYAVPFDILEPTSRINCSVTLQGIKYVSYSRSMQYNKSGYPGNDYNDTTNVSAQDSTAPGGSTLNLINSYLIWMSILAILTLTREIV